MQEYDIIDYIGKEEDNDGGTSIKYKCVDQDGLRCHIRLRALSDGTAQLYVRAVWIAYREFIRPTIHPCTSPEREQGGQPGGKP